MDAIGIIAGNRRCHFFSCFLASNPSTFLPDSQKDVGRDFNSMKTRITPILNESRHCQ
jgi:hypothetical protein